MPLATIQPQRLSDISRLWARAYISELTPSTMKKIRSTMVSETAANTG